MGTTSNIQRRTSKKLLGQAVHRNRTLSVDGLAERAFSLAFRQLVYPQIWEDPIVDMDALRIDSSSRMLTIASGGCNALSYLCADPAHITAVDLNAAHVALNKLKICALRTFSEHADFFRFFGNAHDPANVGIYQRVLRPHLDATSQAYWDGRDITGRRRITWFARGFYRFGLLGRFIGTAHWLGRRFGVDGTLLLRAQSIEEQREIFAREIAPLFDRPFVRWILNGRASLFGLGIPPAQYKALAGDGKDGMAAIVRARLERLACDFALSDNYFAWQAFARGYAMGVDGPLPPYLQPDNFAIIKSRVDRLDIRLSNLVDHLREQPERSVDRVVLLDAQDWMSNEILDELWTEITRAARPGARVIFRTADIPDLLPGRVSDTILGKWRYEREISADCGARDRSAIYGAFHLYVLGESP